MRSKSLIRLKNDFILDYFCVPELTEELSLIKILSTPYFDFHKKFFEYKKFNYSYIPGSEAVGIIEKTNEESKNLSYGLEQIKKGDLVYIEPSVICGNLNCDTCMNGSYSTCKNKRSYGENNINKFPYLLGTLSEYMVILPGSKLHKIPSQLSKKNSNLIGIFSKAIRCVSKIPDGKIGNNIIILGSSFFSLCCAIVAKYIGFDHVIIIDEGFKESEKNILDQLNINYCNLLTGENYNIIIDNKCNQKLLNETLKRASSSAKIIIPLNYSKSKNIVMPRETLSSKELSFVGVSNPSWDTKHAIKFIQKNTELLENIPYQEYGLEDYGKIINNEISINNKYSNVLIIP